MLVFVEEGKPKNLDKNSQSKARTNNKLSPHIAMGYNQTCATLMGGEHSHNCSIPTPQAGEIQVLKVQEQNFITNRKTHKSGHLQGIKIWPY